MDPRELEGFREHLRTLPMQDVHAYLVATVLATMERDRASANLIEAADGQVAVAVGCGTEGAQWIRDGFAAVKQFALTQGATATVGSEKVPDRGYPRPGPRLVEDRP